MALNPAKRKNKTTIKVKRAVIVAPNRSRKRNQSVVGEVARTVERAGTLAAGTAAKTVSETTGAVKRIAKAATNPRRRRRKNIEQGYYDTSGQFHPVRASTDYDSRRAGKAQRFDGDVFARDRRTKQWHRIPVRGPWKSKAAAIAAANAETKRRGKRAQYAAFKAVGKGQEPNPKRRGKRNPSAESIRKEFAGSVSGSRDLYFPQGTPQGLAKLGKLVSIKTEEGTLKPVSGTAWLCADTNGHLHIGTTQNKPLWDGSAHSFGQVREVEYEASKPHLGFPNPIVFYHKLGEETGHKPTLRADGKGGLKFHGGRYRITREGIVN